MHQGQTNFWNQERVAAYSAHEVRKLDKEDFESVDEMEDDAKDNVNEDFIFDDSGENRVSGEYGF